jgi:8-hydroxy-5-deazaflavin:NADPH oxidoreductase
VIAHNSSGAQALAKKVRKADVVSAFRSVPSEVLFDVFDAKRRTRRRASLVYCRDDQDAKDVREDEGPEIAYRIEPFGK